MKKPNKLLPCPYYCESLNTKFCHFNNYCVKYLATFVKRYRTIGGGALRSVPMDMQKSSKHACATEICLPVTGTSDGEKLLAFSYGEKYQEGREKGEKNTKDTICLGCRSGGLTKALSWRYSRAMTKGDDDRYARPPWLLCVAHVLTFGAPFDAQIRLRIPLAMTRSIPLVRSRLGVLSWSCYLSSALLASTPQCGIAPCRQCYGLPSIHGFAFGPLSRYCTFHISPRNHTIVAVPCLVASNLASPPRCSSLPPPGTEVHSHLRFMAPLPSLKPFRGTVSCLVLKLQLDLRYGASPSPLYLAFATHPVFTLVATLSASDCGTTFAPGFGFGSRFHPEIEIITCHTP